MLISITLKQAVCGLIVIVFFAAAWELSGGFGIAAAGDKVLAGYLEKVTIGQGTLLFKAKLDTGARHSSLNATGIRLFQRNGAHWVSFEVTDSTGKTLRLEKKAVRMAGVKMRNETMQERPVVLMPICLGPIQKEVEINLVDRSFFNYQVLIGRSFLAGAVIVDAEAKYLHNPKTCRKGEAP